MSRRSRFARSARATLPQISLTPLIDTVLVLLVIFMVAAPMSQRLLRIDLPQSFSDEKNAPTAQEIIEVRIDKNKIMTINDTVVNQATFIKTLEEIAASLEKPIVVIHADGVLSYKDFIELVVDYIKQVGKIHYVFVAAKHKRAH